MRESEFATLLREVTARKAANEQEDSDLERKIQALQAEMKAGQINLEQKVKDLKERRFEGLKRERELLCLEIKSRTNFEGDVLGIYTEAERGNLKGEKWATFMLNGCGCVRTSGSGLPFSKPPKEKRTILEQ